MYNSNSSYTKGNAEMKSLQNIHNAIAHSPTNHLITQTFSQKSPILEPIHTQTPTKKPNQKARKVKLPWPHVH